MLFLHKRFANIDVVYKWISMGPNTLQLATQCNRPLRAKDVPQLHLGPD